MSDRHLTLAIDTCLEALSVGLGDGERVLASSEIIGVGHAEHLAPKVSALLNEYGAGPSDVTDIIATVGPGSFMGTRVGLSFAMGFALPRQLPTRPVTTLDALWLSAPEGASGAVLIDARRDQVYGQTFQAGVTGEAFLLDIEEARARTEEVSGGVLIGSGVPLVWPEGTVTGPRTPDIEALLGHTAQIVPSPLRPLYLRPPDARPMKERTV